MIIVCAMLALAYQALNVSTDPTRPIQLLYIGNLLGLFYIGAAILSSWATLALSRRWRPQPTWLDRVGRVVGVAWLQVGVVSGLALGWMSSS